MIVLDASAAVAWLLKEPSPAAGFDDLLVSRQIIVPAHWTMEVGHAVLKSLRRKRVTADELTSISQAVRRFDIAIEPATDVSGMMPLLEFAHQNGLTMYDAAYVELALKRRAALATLDQGMRKAAMALGVELAMA